MVARPNAALAQIRTQIMWSRLIAVVEEQAQTMLRTAFSTSVREAGDLSAGVFDRDGRMLAQAVTGTPGHVNSMANAVIHFLKEFPLAGMKPGDHYITNDPWLTSGHLHDITVVTPSFYRGEPVGLFANTIHVVDIGGLRMRADAAQPPRFAEGPLSQQPGHGRLRQAARAQRRPDDFRGRHPRRLRRHVDGVEPWHQRRLQLLPRLHGVRRQMPGGARGAEQRGLARPDHGRRAGRLRPPSEAAVAAALAPPPPPHA